MIKGKELSLMRPNWGKNQMGLFGERQVAGGDRTCLGATMKYASYSQLLWKNTPKL